VNSRGSKGLRRQKKNGPTTSGGYGTSKRKKDKLFPWVRNKRTATDRRKQNQPRGERCFTTLGKKIPRGRDHNNTFGPGGKKEKKSTLRGPSKKKMKNGT